MIAKPTPSPSRKREGSETWPRQRLGRSGVGIAFAFIFGVTACAPTPDPGPPVEQAYVDYLLVDKSDRTLWAYSDGEVVRSYTGLQFGDVVFGHKQVEGDERTPEGRYTIDTRNPNSSFHLSLRVSYPNAADSAFAEAQGMDPGGEIFLHGQPNAMPIGRMTGDWTDGCIAFTNAEIEELYTLVADGTVIDIRQ